MHVKVTKLRESTAPLVRSGTWDTYRLGEVNEVSLPVDYEIEGQLIAPIAVGAAIEVLRTVRNGVQCPGVFRSSPVVRIDPEEGHGLVINATTLNSVYRLEAKPNGSGAPAS